MDSNGERQERQKYDETISVGPKAEICSVLSDPHQVQMTRSVSAGPSGLRVPRPTESSPRGSASSASIGLHSG